MRNLKKAMALVLVFALALSMVASAASFDDVPSSYAYSEEVELLADLGVLVGVDGANFEPDSTLTRIQAAAVIFRCLTGRTSADMYAGATAFWDVDSTYWGTGYINFCADIGAVGGYPDGSFKPDQDVTVAEFESMLVRALGLTEGKTLSYPNGYLAIADANLVNEDVDSVASTTPASRGLVAKLAYNAICNATYQTIATSENTSPKIIEEIFKITPTEVLIVGANGYSLQGSVTAPDADDDDVVDVAADDGEIAYAYADDDGDDTLFGVGETSKASVDLLGQIVKIYLQDDDDEIFAVVPTSDNTVVTIKNQEVYKTSSKYYYKDEDGSKQYFTAPDAAADTDDEIGLYMNYAYQNSSNDCYTFDASDTDTDVFINNGSSTSGTAGQKMLRELILVSNDGSDSSVEYIFAKQYEVGEYDGISGDYMYFDALDSTTTNAPEKLDISGDDDVADVTYPSGISDGDGVMIYRDDYTAEVTLLETISGELTKISSGTYTIGGTTYKFAYSLEGTDNYYSETTSYSASDIGDSFDLLIAPGFDTIISTSEVTASIGNYFYVTGAKVDDDYDDLTYWLQGYTTDGDEEEYQLKGTYSSHVADLDAIYAYAFSDADTATSDLAAIYTITVNSSDKITKATVPTSYTSDLEGETLDKDSYNSTSGLLASVNKVNTTSVCFFDEDLDGEDVDVYVGTFPSLSSSGAAVELCYVNSSQPPVIKAALFDGEAKGSTSALENVFGVIISGYSVVSAGDDEYYIEATILTQGDDEETYRTESMDDDDIDEITDVYAKNTLITFDLTTDGYIAVADDPADTFHYVVDPGENGTLDDPDDVDYDDIIYDKNAFLNEDTDPRLFIDDDYMDNVTTYGGATYTGTNLIGIGAVNDDEDTTDVVEGANRSSVAYYTVSDDVIVYNLDMSSPSSGDLATFGTIRTLSSSNTEDSNHLVLLVFDTDDTDDIESGDATVIEIFYFDD